MTLASYCDCNKTDGVQEEGYLTAMHSERLSDDVSYSPSSLLMLHISALTTGGFRCLEATPSLEVGSVGLCHMFCVSESQDMTISMSVISGS